MNQRDSELPPPIEYNGSSRALSNSRFLTAADLIEAGLSYGGSITVTIARVLRRDNVVSQFSGKPETMTTLEFVGKKKEFRVGATILKTLNQLFGDNCAGWKGKQVQLVLAQKENRGELMDSIVLRGVRPAGAPPRPPAAQPQVLPDPVDLGAGSNAGTGNDQPPDDCPF